LLLLLFTSGCHFQSAPLCSGISPSLLPSTSSAISAVARRSCGSIPAADSSAFYALPARTFASLAFRHYATSIIKLYTLSRFINWYLQSYPDYCTGSPISEALQHYFVYTLNCPMSPSMTSCLANCNALYCLLALLLHPASPTASHALSHHCAVCSPSCPRPRLLLYLARLPPRCRVLSLRPGIPSSDGCPLGSMAITPMRSPLHRALPPPPDEVTSRVTYLGYVANTLSLAKEGGVKETTVKGPMDIVR